MITVPQRRWGVGVEGAVVQFLIVMLRNDILSFLCPRISLSPCPQHAVLRCVFSTS